MHLGQWVISTIIGITIRGIIQELFLPDRISAIIVIKEAYHEADLGEVDIV
jgi:hypothetical protein